MNDKNKHDDECTANWTTADECTCGKVSFDERQMEKHTIERMQSDMKDKLGIWSENEGELQIAANSILTLAVQTAKDPIQILDMISDNLYTDDETEAIRKALSNMTKSKLTA